jgi:hypothetical protein
MVIWIFFLVLVRGTRAQNFPAPFNYTLHKTTLTQSTVPWVVTPHRSQTLRHFGGTYRSHHQGRRVIHPWNQQEDYCSDSACLLRLFFDIEDGGSKFLRNVSGLLTTRCYILGEVLVFHMHLSRNGNLRPALFIRFEKKMGTSLASEEVDRLANDPRFWRHSWSLLHLLLYGSNMLPFL